MIVTSVNNTNHVWLITRVIIVRDTLNIIHAVLAVRSKSVIIVTRTQERADGVQTNLFTVMTAVGTLINVLAFNLIDFFVPWSTPTLIRSSSISTFLITYITLILTLINVLTVVSVSIFQFITHRTLTLVNAIRQWIRPTGVRTWSVDTGILN